MSAPLPRIATVAELAALPPMSVLRARTGQLIETRRLSDGTPKVLGSIGWFSYEQAIEELGPLELLHQPGTPPVTEAASVAAGRAYVREVVIGFVYAQIVRREQLTAPLDSGIIPPPPHWREQTMREAAPLLAALGLNETEEAAAAAPYPEDLYVGCPCWECDQAAEAKVAANQGRIYFARMALCPTCGSKRCPGARNHADHPTVETAP